VGVDVDEAAGLEAEIAGRRLSAEGDQHPSPSAVAPSIVSTMTVSSFWASFVATWPVRISTP
jgi:hypothetical protein